MVKKKQKWTLDEGIFLSVKDLMRLTGSNKLQ